MRDIKRENSIEKMKEQETDVVDIETAPSSVRLEGIFKKGYGYLPKMAMFDPDLTIEAKAIYALFCSYAGSGEDVDMPRTDEIRHILHIGKNAYLKHFNLLITNGYVRVEQVVKGGNAKNSSYFAKNVYTVVKMPDKYKTNRPDGRYKKEYAAVRTRGDLIGAGYGLIPKLPLLSDSMSIAVKGVYSYLMTFATREEPVVWPSYEMITNHLNISRNTAAKYLRELAATSFVQRMDRERALGKYTASQYIIVFNPELTPNTKIEATEPKGKIYTTEPNTKIEATEPSTKIEATEPNTKIEATEPSTKIEATEPDTKIEATEPSTKIEATEPSTKKPATEKPTTKKPTTENDAAIYNTSINNTSSNNTILPSTPVSGAGMIDGFENEFESEIMNSDDRYWYLDQVISEAGNIPERFLFNDRYRTETINYLCEWEFRAKRTFYDDDVQWKIYITFCNAIKAMLNPAAETMPNSKFKVSYYHVWEQLQTVLEFSKDGTVTLSGFVDSCMRLYFEAIKTRRVKSPLEYMKAIIWNTMLDGGLAEESEWMHTLYEE